MIESNCMLYQLKNKISIVIPFYDEDDDIETLLDSISIQYYINGVDVIIVNHTENLDIVERVNKKNKELKNINISVIDELKEVIHLKTKKHFILHIDPNVVLDSEWTLFNYVSHQAKNGKIYYSFKNEDDNSESYLEKFINFFSHSPTENNTPTTLQ